MYIIWNIVCYEPDPLNEKVLAELDSGSSLSPQETIATLKPNNKKISNSLSFNLSSIEIHSLTKI